MHLQVYRAKTRLERVDGGFECKPHSSGNFTCYVSHRMTKSHFLDSSYLKISAEIRNLGGLRGELVEVEVNPTQ